MRSSPSLARLNLLQFAPALKQWITKSAVSPHLDYTAPQTTAKLAAEPAADVQLTFPTDNSCDGCLRGFDGCGSDGSDFYHIINPMQRLGPIVSGIQPTGIPHLGNYLGAVVHWVSLQKRVTPGTPLLYFLADLHAITTPYEPGTLKNKCRCIIDIACDCCVMYGCRIS